MGKAMTYSELMKAVISRLEELFQQQYPVYEEAAFQTTGGQADLPGFAVRLLEATETPRLGRRYFRETALCIRFIPGSGGQGAGEQADMVETLMNGLEYVETADGTLRGAGRNAVIKDGVLHFFVNYNAFVVKPLAKEETMGNLNIKEEVKKG